MKLFFTILFSVLLLTVQAQYKASEVAMFKEKGNTELDAQVDVYRQYAMQVWDLAEVGYKEYKSSALLQKLLEENGFTIEKGVAEIPTAFVASYGSGSPVIGILAEYDALPGISQDSVPVKKVIDEKHAGHACGHHLLGVGSVASAIELKKMIEGKAFSGTIKIFGTPAEEGGSGKVYMVKAGLFDDVDAVIHWHPGSQNAVMGGSCLANVSVKFRFRGLASHAGGAPEKGRSALDGVESMNYMVNMMREHVPSDTRLHYIITNGGQAANVVPEFAEVYYYLRSPSKDNIKPLFTRLINTAKGAALGTDTKMDYEIIGGTYDLLINQALAEVMQKNLEEVGGVTYSSAEKAFATTLRESFTHKGDPLESVANVKPLSSENGLGGSTDVGDVSWKVPTVGLSTATWVANTPGHSWQAIAAGGTSIGVKGMMVAAKTILGTAIDLFTNEDLLAKAKEEYQSAIGPDFSYEALLGDRKPALNYRD